MVKRKIENEERNIVRQKKENCITKPILTESSNKILIIKMLNY